MNRAALHRVRERRDELNASVREKLSGIKVQAVERHTPTDGGPPFRLHAIGSVDDAQLVSDLLSAHGHTSWGVSEGMYPDEHIIRVHPRMSYYDYDGDNRQHPEIILNVLDELGVLPSDVSVKKLASAAGIKMRPTPVAEWAL